MYNFQILVYGQDINQEKELCEMIAKTEYIESAPTKENGWGFYSPYNGSGFTPAYVLGIDLASDIPMNEMIRIRDDQNVDSLKEKYKLFKIELLEYLNDSVDGVNGTWRKEVDKEELKELDETHMKFVEFLNSDKHEGFYFVEASS